ncbi:MAG TPA: hypothetical protein VGR31_03785 [Planctomycetota bacterium]|nr:hypothetical protein [Planctomycetota bacterium]
MGDPKPRARYARIGRIDAGVAKQAFRRSPPPTPAPSPEFGNRASDDTIDRICLFVMIASVCVGVLGLALLFLPIFGSDPEQNRRFLGEWIAKIAFATTAAAGWIRTHHKKWLNESPRPGGLPMLNSESKAQSLWLLGFSMVVPYFAAVAGIGSIAILVATFGPNSRDASATPAWVPMAGAGATLVTALYALIVARNRQATSKGSWIDAAVVLPALMSLLSSAFVLLSRSRIDLVLPAHPIVAVVGSVAVLLTVVYAGVLSNKLKPRDKWGRAADTGWFKGKKQHA